MREHDVNSNGSCYDSFLKWILALSWQSGYSQSKRTNVTVISKKAQWSY